jgi:hypothetical protein
MAFGEPAVASGVLASVDELNGWIVELVGPPLDARKRRAREYYYVAISDKHQAEQAVAAFARAAHDDRIEAVVLLNEQALQLLRLKPGEVKRRR